MSYDKNKRPLVAKGFAEGSIETGTTASNLSQFGVSLIGATAASTFTLAAPIKKGVTKYIFCTQSTGVALQVNFAGSAQVRTTAGSTMTSLTFNADGETAVLVAESTTKWLLVSHVGVASA